jgi:hypothetical protein
MVKKVRQIMSFAMMLLGIVMLARGVENSLNRHLGLQGLVLSCVLGALVFALGFARWRYLQQRN